MSRGVLILTVCAVIAGSAFAGSIYVDAAASGGSGSSWAAAYNNLQTAITAASSGDTIYLAVGVYKPALPGGDRAASFVLKNGVNLKGGYTLHPGLSDSARYGYSTLSGDLNGNDPPLDLSAYAYALKSPDPPYNKADNSYHVVTGSDVTAVLDRICIAYGYDNQPGVTNKGGGMRLMGYNNITMENCLVTQNYSNYWGGGIYSEGGIGSNYPHINLSNCDITYNSCQRDGGGVFMNVSSYAVVKGCRFIGNSSWDYYGGGLYFLACCVAEVTDCYFAHNNAWDGGGLEFRMNRASNMNLENSICNVSNCVFDTNWATWAGPHFVYEDNADSYGFYDRTESTILNMKNCLFANGLSTNKSQGAVTVVSDSIYPEDIALTANFTNCTIVNQKTFVEPSVGLSLTGLCLGYWRSNFVGDAGGWLYVNVKNCILWTGGIEIGPRPQDLPAGLTHFGATLTTSYNCIGSNPKNFLGTQTDNITADPQFVVGDYMFNVQATSPTIDTGDPADDWSKEPRCNGERINMGWTGGIGRATPKVIVPHVLDGDVNCDGNVDLADFSKLASEWLL
jgi:hypothetical protein